MSPAAGASANTGGLIRSTILTNGSPTAKITDTRIHNSFGEIETYEARYNDTEILYSVAYSRDDLGRIKQKSEIIAKPSGGIDSFDWTYSYDSVGRLDLVTMTKNGQLVEDNDYDYDANGNRIAGPGLATPPSYDDQDRLLSYLDANYTSTANGELVTKNVGGSSTTAYEYDALGSLRRVTLPDDTVIEYVIDGTGRRIGRKTGTTTDVLVLEQGFIYDDQLRIVAELDGSNAVISRFVHGTYVNVPDYMIKEGVTDSVYRIIADELGSVRLVVDVATGLVLQRIDYDETGIATLVQGSWDAQPFGYAGGLFDPVTSLTRFGARDYDAATGRWTAKDQLRFGGGSTNLYLYALGDPINRTDPTGLISDKPCQGPFKPRCCANLWSGCFAVANNMGEAAEAARAMCDYNQCRCLAGPAAPLLCPPPPPPPTPGPGPGADAGSCSVVGAS